MHRNLSLSLRPAGVLIFVARFNFASHPLLHVIPPIRWIACTIRSPSAPPTPPPLLLFPDARIFVRSPLHHARYELPPIRSFYVIYAVNVNLAARARQFLAAFFLLSLFL